MAPTNRVPQGNGCKGLKFSSDDEMIEYYKEALLEAIVFCMTTGMSEDYVISLDVFGFGEVYKYLKRIDARDQMRRIGDMRTAQGASAKQYKKYLGGIEVWLPTIETSNSTTHKSKNSFDNLIQRGHISG